MGKVSARAEILRMQEISPGIFDMVLAAPEIALEAKAGQFVNVYLNDAGRLLPRPVSICCTDPERGTIRLVFRVSRPGSGTEVLGRMSAGETLRLLGPLGNGFPQDVCRGKRVVLVGGGIGIPPMLGAAQMAAGLGAAAVDIVLGYRDICFLSEDFAPLGEVHIATENGETGVCGTVVDAMNADAVSGDVLFACGPAPMLRAAADYAAQNGMECYVSMEERMACGVGACLACVCKSAERDDHSNVFNKRVCKDGPVFRAEEIVI